METKNYSNEINGLIKNIATILDTLDKININTSDFKNKLESITSKLNIQDEFELDEKTYIEAIKELKLLTNNLTNYNIYIKINALSNNNLLNIEQDNNKINEIANQIVNILIELNETKTIYYSQEILKNFYALIFDTMILELSINKQSIILEYVKTDYNSFNHLNNLTYKKAKSLSDEKIEEKLNNIQATEGIEADYLKIELLELIEKESSTLIRQQINEIEKKLTIILYKIKENNIKVNQLNLQENNLEDKLLYTRKLRFKKIVKNILAISIIASIMTICTVSTIYINKEDLYETKRDQYTSIDDSYKTTTKNEPQTTSGIYIYQIISSSDAQRIINKYYINSPKFANLKRYLTLDLSNYPYTQISEEITSDNEKYPTVNTAYLVEQITQKDVIIETKYKKSMINFTLSLELIIFVSLFLYFSQNYIINNINYTKDIKNIKNALNILEKNKELQQLFCQIYKENKNILNNHLYQKTYEEFIQILSRKK